MPIDLNFLIGLFGRVPAGRASADYATLQNILRMVPLRVLRIPIAYFTKFYVLKLASMVLALKNMLHPKIQKHAVPLAKRSACDLGCNRF